MSCVAWHAPEMYAPLAAHAPVHGLHSTGACWSLAVRLAAPRNVPAVQPTHAPPTLWKPALQSQGHE
jgi:hypothetical protein